MSAPRRPRRPAPPPPAPETVETVRIVTLTATQSNQWLRGDPDALQIEWDLARWARAHKITTTVLARLSTGRWAFGLRLPSTGGAV